MKTIHNPKPYIILGVHRSGTTLMSGIFTRAGIFMGKNQNINKEAEFFFQLNNKALTTNKSTAYDFDIFLEKLNNPEFVNQLTQKFKHELSLNLNSKFFGYKNLIKYLITDGKIKWGFKDPRNVLLYPVWNNIFPDAKYLIIFRNPIDVCISTYYFEQKRYLKKLKKRPGLKFGMPLEKAFEVWKKFNKILLTIAENKSNSLVVKYEDLKNKEVIDKLIEFTGSSVSQKEISNMIKDKPNKYILPEGYSKLIDLVKNDDLVQKLYPNLKF